MADTERAVFRIFVKGTMEAVWRQITKTDEPQEAFFNMRLHAPNGLAPGAAMQMRSKSGKVVGAVGEVLAFDPPRKYSHTFRFTQYDDPPCIVTYELEPKDDGVQFTMTLDNLPKDTKTTKQMKQGGTMITSTLKSMVETGKPSFGTRMLFVLFRVLEPMSPKRTRVENWR